MASGLYEPVAPSLRYPMPTPEALHGILAVAALQKAYPGTAGARLGYSDSQPDDVPFAKPNMRQG